MATLAGQTDGYMEQQVLAAQTALHIGFAEEADWQPDYKIRGFHLTGFRPRADPEEVDNQGKGFNADVLRLLSTCQAGDRLVFEEIRVQCPGEPQPRMIRALSLRVK